MRKKYLTRELLLVLTTFILAACATPRPVVVDPAVTPIDASRASAGQPRARTAGPFPAPAVAPTAQSLAVLYKEMAPVEAYIGTSEADEIALARSAAPPAISKDAEVLAFDVNGYHRAVVGTNGWTCLVERSWNDDYGNPEFWNPRIRVPICFNPPATRTILPVYLERTTWVLAKRSLPAIVAIATSHPVPDPEIGSLAMMLSKDGYVADAVGTPGPHLMVFFAGVPAEAWAANLDGVPIGAAPGDKPSITVFFVSSRVWSDGTAR